MQRGITHFIISLPVAFCALVLFAFPARAADDAAPHVQLFRNVHLQDRLTAPNTWTVYDEAFRGGVRVALGDVNGDGSADMVVAPGPGGGPHIQAFTQSGKRIASFFVYAENFRNGLTVATGDVNGDGTDEIITGAASLDGSEVKVFMTDGTLLKNFYPYDDVFRGDISVASGDVDGDKHDEIITGSGPGGSPHVRIFDGDGTWLGLDYFPYASWDRGGVSVAAADTTGDGRAEVITSIMSNGPAIVKVYEYAVTRPILATFYAYPETFTGGAQIAAADIDGDGHAEIMTGAGSGGGPQVRTFTAAGDAKPAWGFAYEQSFRGGIFVAASSDKNGATILTGPNSREAFAGGKRIMVDISEQRLYAYSGNVQVNTFLISSGLPGFETPRGDFAVRDKIPVKDYFAYYGPGNPHNYNLPNTKWNMHFYGPFLLHGAYWHNDFGKKKSHGCVNIHYRNAEWLYNWSNIGTPVHIQD